MDVETHMVYPEALPPETLISGWRILCRSGKGGFGAVYRVEDASRPGEVYALKMALRRGDPRVEREATLLMTRTGHPNVVRVHGCGRWPHPKEGYRYIVMDYVEGPNLIGWAEGTNPTFQQLGSVLDKLALALGFLHGHGAWHRDVKPENILVRARDGEPILLDLSVGDYDGADTLTDQPLPPGTLHCRSPEALRFNRNHWGKAGARYDYKATDELYALGVTAYRVMTGHWPFPPNMERELLEDAILWRTPLSPDRVNPRVPPELAALVMRLMDKDPQARFQDTRELHEALVAASAFGKAEVWEATCFEWESPPEGARRVRLPEPPELPPAPKLPQPPRAVHFAPVAGREGAMEPEARGPRPGEPGSARAAREHSAPPLLARSWKRAALFTGGALLFVAGLFLGMVGLLPTSEVGSKEPTQATHEVAKSAESSEAQRAAEPPPAESTPAVVAAPATLSEEPISMKTKRATGAEPAKQRKSNHLKKAAAAAACLELSTACAGAQVKPFQEEACPPEALAAMKQLRLDIGESGLLFLDVHQLESKRGGEVGVYKDGPIVSVFKGSAQSTLPYGTLLKGTLWTYSGRKSRSGLDIAYGRYTEAETPDGKRYPICFILGDREGVNQEKSSQPGAVLLPRTLPFTIVKRFVFEEVSGP
jgi:eukaryotic-like serine/threonine-protein kinase